MFDLSDIELCCLVSPRYQSLCLKLIQFTEASKDFPVFVLLESPIVKITTLDHHNLISTVVPGSQRMSQLTSVESELFRNMVLAQDGMRALCDPILLEVMTDPVIASDGHSYERSSIELWFKNCRTKGFALTSPMTNALLDNGNLTMNHALRSLIDTAKMQFMLYRGSTEGSDTANALAPPPPEIGMIRMLTSEIFSDMDRLMEINIMTELELRMAQIVAIGGESNGKSSVLERLIGFSVFPRSMDLCTRCIIRVHLRRGPGEVSSIVTRDRQTNSTLEETRKYVALDKICVEVKLMMDNIIAQEPGNAISLTKEILIEIRVPYCPNLNIVDLPGQVAANPQDPAITQDVPKATIDLAQAVISQEKDYSIFLLVVSATIPVNQSFAAQMVRQNGIEAKTVGVLTKMDVFFPTDDINDSLLNTLNNSNLYCTKHGWYACSNRSPNPLDMRDLERLCKIEDYESGLKAKERFLPYFATQRAGMDVIRRKIQIMFEDFICTEWVPRIREHLKNYFLTLSDNNANLGMPIPRDIDYVHSIGELTSTIPVLYPEYDINGLKLQDGNEFKDQLRIRVAEVCKNMSWMNFHAQKKIWQSNFKYEEFRTQRTQNWDANLLPFETAGDNAMEAQTAAVKILQTLVTQLHDFGAGGTIANALVAAIIDEQASKENIYVKAWNFLFKPTELAKSFKFDRFPTFMNSYRVFITESVKTTSANFRNKTNNQITKWSKEPLQFVCAVPSVQGSDVVCRIKWVGDMELYPSYIMGQWMETVAKGFLTLTDAWVVPAQSLNEECKVQRMGFLRQMVDVVKVLYALKVMEEKVILLRST